jgi:hypothetical protein
MGDRKAGAIRTNPGAVITSGTCLPSVWTSKDVAQFLNVSESTLSRWRRRGIGPACVQIDGVSRYRPAAVEAWLEETERAYGRAARA